MRFWVCLCGWRNMPSESHCWICGKAKPVPAPSRTDEQQEDGR